MGACDLTGQALVQRARAANHRGPNCTMTVDQARTVARRRSVTTPAARSWPQP